MLKHATKFCCKACKSLGVVVVLLLVSNCVSQTTAAPCLQSRAKSAFLTGVATDLPADTQKTFCNDTTTRVVVRPEDTGVQHFVLSGHVPRHLVGKQGNGWQFVQHDQSYAHEADSLPAILHLWIRALCSRGVTTVRAFGMLQGDADGRESIHGEFDLDIHLNSLGSKQHHSLEVLWRDEEEDTRFHSPFTAETSFLLEETAAQYIIQVGGFHGHVIWSPHVYSCPGPADRKTPAVMTVLTHSYSDSADLADLEVVAQVLVEHVRYHCKLGLVGTVHYEVEPYLSYLANHSEVQTLVEDGSLRLIGWDMQVQLEYAFGLLLQGSAWHKDRSKVLQYNHAILAHWGLDVYINTLDNDEFLATNEPTNVSQMLVNGCIVPHGNTNALRYDIRCGGCNYSSGNGTETDLWRSPEKQNRLTQYTETDFRMRLRGKPILYADASFSMSIHESGVFHSGQEDTSYCFYHIHVVNLFAPRRDASDVEFTNDTSWQWVLRDS